MSDALEQRLRQAARRARAALVLGPGSLLAFLAVCFVGELVDVRPFAGRGHSKCCGVFVLCFGHACAFVTTALALPAWQLRPVPREVRWLYGYWVLGPAVLVVVAAVNAALR